MSDYEVAGFVDAGNDWWRMNRVTRLGAWVAYIVILIYIYAFETCPYSLSSVIDVGVWSGTAEEPTLTVEQYDIYEASLRHTLGAVAIMAVVTETLKTVFDFLGGWYAEILRNNVQLWKWTDVAIIDALFVVFVFQICGEVNFFIHVFTFLLMMSAMYLNMIASRKEEGGMAMWTSSLVIQFVVWLAMMVLIVISTNESPNNPPTSLTVVVIVIIASSIVVQIVSLGEMKLWYSSDRATNHEMADTLHTFFNALMRVVVISIVLHYLLNDVDFSLSPHVEACASV